MKFVFTFLLFVSVAGAQAQAKPTVEYTVRETVFATCMQFGGVKFTDDQVNQITALFKKKEHYKLVKVDPDNGVLVLQNLFGWKRPVKDAVLQGYAEDVVKIVDPNSGATVKRRQSATATDCPQSKRPVTN